MKGLTPTAGGAQAHAQKKPSKAKAKAKAAPASDRPEPISCVCPKCGAAIEFASSDRHRTYMQLDRMMRIHEALRLNKFPSQTQLAEQLGYDRQAIMADMEFMRSRLHMPLAYIAAKRGWGYTQPLVEFPLLHITEEELIALCVVARAAAAFPGTPFAAIIRRILEKFRYYIGDRIKYSLEEVEAAISFGPAVAPSVDSKVYEEMLMAALKGEEVECMYEKLQGAPPSKRVLQPVHVTPRNGQWYALVQNREKAQKIATYKLSRASEVKRTGKHFEKVDRAEWEKPLAECAGIYLGGTVETIRLRLTAVGVKLATENPLHATQQIVPGPDGTAELTMQCPVNPEQETRILALGREARTLAPDSLRKSIGEVGRQLAAWAEEVPPGQSSQFST